MVWSLRLKASLSLWVGDVRARALHSGLLFDPASVLGDAGVDARLVFPSAAVSPTHHPGQEHATSLGGAGEGPAGIPLGGTHTDKRRV